MGADVGSVALKRGEVVGEVYARGEAGGAKGEGAVRDADANRVPEVARRVAELNDDLQLPLAAAVVEGRVQLSRKRRKASRVLDDVLVGPGNVARCTPR
jgi:hypothetical protein